MPIGESTFSASFYVDVAYQGRFDHYSMQVKKQKGKDAEADAETAPAIARLPRGEVLLLKRSDWTGLRTLLADGLEPVAETANWVAFRRRQ